MLNQPSAENRPNSGSDCAKARPQSNCASAFLLGERIADDRKAARDKKCRAESLKRAGNATFTTVPSINAMLEARMVAARIQRPRVFEHGAAARPDRIMFSSQAS